MKVKTVRRKARREIYDNWKARQERKWKFRQLSVERVQLTVIGVCVASIRMKAKDICIHNQMG